MGLLSALGKLGRRARPDALTAGQRNAMEARGLSMYIPPGAQRERWAKSRDIERQLNNIEDMILQLPAHEQPVADMVLREQGADAAARWIRQTMGGS